MLEIRVCTEGACSNKGAYAVFRALSCALEAQGLEDAVELSPSGCIKDCNKAGVCAAIGETVYSLLPETAARFVTEVVLPLAGDAGAR